MTSPVWKVKSSMTYSPVFGSGNSAAPAAAATAISTAETSAPPAMLHVRMSSSPVWLPLGQAKSAVAAHQALLREAERHDRVLEGSTGELGSWGRPKHRDRRHGRPGLRARVRQQCRPRPPALSLRMVRCYPAK